MKIPIQNIYYMLCYAWNKVEYKSLIELDRTNFNNYYDFYAFILIKGLNHLLKQGFDRKYITYTEETTSIKGKFDFNNTIKKNSLIKSKVVCSYDDLSYNNLHNQIIKFTIRKLLLINDLDKENKANLRNLYFNFYEIDLLNITKKDFSKIQLNRNNQFYDFILKICELIFDNLILDEQSGNYFIKDILAEERFMHNVYESFIRNFYKIELKTLNEKYSVYRENIEWNLLTLDETSKKMLPNMQTDTSIEFSDRKIIMETKYYQETLQKNYEKESIRNHHINQLFAYLSNYRNKAQTKLEGFLLYPQTDRKLNQKYKANNFEIGVKTINLNQEWKNIYKDLMEFI